MNRFESVRYDFNFPYDDIHDQKRGLTEEEVILHQERFGQCTMNIIIKSWYNLLIEEIANFYYAIQLFSITIWFMNDYYRSGAIVALMTLAAVASELYDQIRSLKRLKEMAHYETEVYVKRVDQDEDSISVKINSNEIVPGDIIIIEEGKKMPCDAILLEGECVVNEAMLTGESLPAIKTALPSSEKDKVESFSIENREQQRHFLFAGTEIVQSRMMKEKTSPFALVTRTNFMTTKGSLIRSILYSAPRRFDLYGETYYVLFVSFLIAAAAMGTVLPKFIDNFSTYHVVIRTMNALTVAIPAILPVCMSVGLLFAYTRLYINEIYCSQPRKIDSAGRIGCMVFDKTGTLTHEGLTAVGIKLSNSKGFDNTIYNISNEIETSEEWRNPNQYDPDKVFLKFIECMACCHSCTYVDNKLLGDPLETEMFKISKWVMDESNELNNYSNGRYLGTFYPKKLSTSIRNNPNQNHDIYKINMLMKNEFLSELQCMSVVVKNNLDGSLV